MKGFGLLLAILSATTGCVSKKHTVAEATTTSQTVCELHGVNLQLRKMYSVDLSVPGHLPHIDPFSNPYYHEVAGRFPHLIPEYFFEEPTPFTTHSYDVEFCPQCEAEFEVALAKRKKSNQPVQTRSPRRPV